MDVSDLGRKVKEKYPGQYDDLSDAEAGRRVKAKYPEYADYKDEAVVAYSPVPDKYEDSPIKYENEPIKAESKKSEYGFVSFVCLGFGGYLIYTALSAPPGTRPDGRVWLAIGLIIAGVFFFRKAKEAYHEESSELSSKIEIKNKQTEFQKLLVREPHVEEQTKRRLVIEETQDKREKNQVELDNHLIDVGKEYGLTSVEVVAVNKEKCLSKIRLNEREEMLVQDTDKRWKEIVQDLDAADLLDLSEQQLIKKLTGYLAEQLRDKHAIETGDDPPPVKVALLARYDKNISYLEAKIDERQAGLLLPPNGQEAKRIGQGETDSPGYSEPEIKAVQEQAPLKRGRGRPRKNPAI